WSSTLRCCPGVDAGRWPTPGVLLKLADLHHRPDRSMGISTHYPDPQQSRCRSTVVRSTSEDLSGHPLGHHVEVQERGKDTFQVPKHGREPQAEQHDEEEHCPHLRARH
ncbi:hypothetical protein AALO_G00260620, partial [Alosa alosa]